MSFKTEIFFVIIVIIVLSSFIGLNIIRIINNKLNKISIKMPKIVVPPANIIIKVQKKNGEYEIYNESKKNIENIKNKKAKEHFKNVNNIKNSKPYNSNEY